MNKLNYLISTFISLSLLSCGQSEQAQAPNKLFPQQVIRSFSVDGLEANEQMRSLTVIIYPQESDLNKFSYLPDDNSKESWSVVKSSLPYGEKLLENYPEKGMSSFQKVEEMRFALGAIGDSRDAAFKELRPLEKKEEGLSKEVKKKKRAVKKEMQPYFNQFICYHKKRPRRGKPFQCRTQQTDDLPRKKKAKSCKDFQRFSFEFDNQDELITYNEAYIKCFDFEEETQILTEQLKLVSNKVRGLKKLRQSGRDIVISLLEESSRQLAENFGKRKSYLTTGASQDNVDEDSDQQISYLKFGERNQTIEELKLFVDFGSYYSEGPGYKEYSIENGKIQNLFYDYKNNVVKRLNFDLHTEDFVMRAKLSMSVQDIFDLRFVGEAKVFYPIGKGQDGNNTYNFKGPFALGGIKFEFDLKK